MATDTLRSPVAGTRPEVRRTTSARTRDDVVVLAGALAAGVGLTALLFTRVAPVSSVLAFVVVSYLVFLAVYALLVSMRDPWVAVRDRLASVVIHSLALVALLALVFIVVFTFWRGREALSHLNFFTTDMTTAGPLDPLTSGGILHAAIGTLVEILIALAVVVPLGLLCAVYLNETRGAFSRFTRTIVEAMTALPSIVAGLFIYAALILGLGLAKSGLAAALAISVMMLPIVIRAADVVIRLVPSSLREASLALGAGQWRTVRHVVLPTARSGLTTAILLGAARGIGETSPVLITAGFGSTLNADPTDGPMVSLPLATFIFSGSPEPTMIARGFGAAAVLLTLVLILFALARVLGGRPAGQLSARQRRRRDRQSHKDALRFEEHA
jgi:phosphate transport system permease protein